jgi:hypothetical protein
MHTKTYPFGVAALTFLECAEGRLIEIVLNKLEATFLIIADEKDE